MHALTLWIYTLVSSLDVAEGPLPPWAMGYGALAASIARAAEARPLPGEHGVDRMAALLVAIAYRESRFRADAVGDGGASLGPFQVSRAWVRPTSDLNGEADIAARLVLDSWRVCAAQPLEHRLAWYAQGGVGCDRRHGTSRDRMRIAAGLLRAYPRPADAAQ